ncbi:GGDEF domain-containing protein [Cohnella lubricantis]|nr:GGDEF domain-containing protein [Cohnella lubricantis]
MGKWFGITLASIISAAAAIVIAIEAEGSGWEIIVGATGIGFACVLLPTGWMLGRHYDRIKSRSERDSLTNAFTRRFIDRCFTRLSEQALRGGKRISVTLVDLNDFKLINDTYGHRSGDEVLVQLAKALASCCNRGEIVGRWGGDEFLILSPYAVRGASNSLHRLIEERMERLSQSTDKPISVAIGTAVFPEDGKTLEQLLQTADRGMYEDKKLRKKEETIHRLKA